jgi:LuxR family maltose regulon positive regulatory protein
MIEGPDVTTDLAMPVSPRSRGHGDDDGLFLASRFMVPEAPRFVVVRRRLLDRLTNGVRAPVTLVTGPAGSGKTLLLASWVTSGAVPDAVAWLALEDGDARPGTFWAYLIEALRRGGAALPESFDPAIRSAPADRAALIRIAAELATLPAPIVLVIDNADHLTAELADDLDFVVQHVDGHVHLVLLGRRDPPLPLYRYRLGGTLTEIRGDDLAFTVGETAELLAGHHIDLRHDAQVALVERTEGWAAGLRLCAMHLQGARDAESMVATIAGDETNIAEYFVGEVLKALPADVRDFLLRTSVLDVITPGAAEALTGRGDAGRMLAELERANAFVQPVVPGSGAYRYHRLFLELLRAQLAYDEPAAVPDLHHRAAGWFAGQGRLVDAVRHAVQAGAWAYASGLLVEDLAVGQLVLDGEAGRYAELLHGMPDTVDGPAAAVVAAALALAASDPDRCAKQLARIEEMVDDHRQDRALRLGVAVLDLMAARLTGDLDRGLLAGEECGALLAQVPADRLAGHPELRALVLSGKGAMQSWLGRVDDAATTLAEGAAVAQAAGHDSVRLDCLEQMALLDAYRGRLRKAATVARQAAHLAAEPGNAGRHRTGAADVTLAWVAIERYDVETAWRHLRAASVTSRAPADALAGAAFALVRSRLLRARGDSRGALDVLDEARTPVGERVLSGWLEREIALSQARLLVAFGRADDAAKILAGFADATDPEAAVVSASVALARGDRVRGQEVLAPVFAAADTAAPVLVEAWLVLAAEAAHDGDAGKARGSLKQALRLATPESYRRAFLESGPRLRQLLRDDRDLAQGYRALETAPRTGRVCPTAVPRQRAAAPIVVDALSEREMEVLRHLAAMLPTEEIAAAMYVSVNTVKTHVRSILRKLSASRRNEAVRRARELGLLPPA